MASNTLMSLLINLGVDSSGVDKGFADTEKKTDKFTSNVGGKLASIGGMLAGGIALGAGAAAVALASTIAPASDLAESINAVNVVFEDGADVIKAYGESAATTVGLSNREFNQLATVTGAFLTNLGYNSAEAADETIVLTERAADLASVFNTDVSTALQAIQSGLKGEFNPLEQFGVKMNAAAIEAKALEMGLADQTGAISDAAKAQAALALFMEQTDKVAGDFTNTSDGMANSQRQLGAMWEDLKAQIGAGLLPAVEKLLGTFKEIAASAEFQAFLDGVIAGVANLGKWLSDAIPTVIEKFGEFTNWMSENRPVVVGVLAAIGVALMAFAITSAIAGVTALLPWLPVIAIIAAVGVAAGFLYKAWTENMGGIQEKTAAVVDWLRSAFESVVTFLQPTIDAVMAVADVIAAVLGKAIEGVAAYITNVWLPNFMTGFNWIKDNVIPIIQDVAKWLGEKLAPAFEGISDAVSGVLDWMHKLADGIRNLELPDWLTPGSPTPFEIGLLGISDALKKVANSSLPGLDANLNMAAASGIPTPSSNTDSSDGMVEAINANKVNEGRLARTIVEAMQAGAT